MFDDFNIVIINELSNTLAFFYYIILALAKLKIFIELTPQIITLILYGRAVFSSEYIKRKTTDNLVIDGFLLVIRLGAKPYIFYR